MAIGFNNPRTEALMRLVIGVALTVTGILPVLFAVAGIAGLLWMVVDVVLQLATGDEGWRTGEPGLGSWLERLFYWPFEISQWVLFGDREMPVTP